MVTNNQHPSCHSERSEESQPLKRFRLRSFVSLIVTSLVACCLLGCGQRSIKGQVFIVTRSAENIKLGLVEVALLDEQSVAALLEKKKPAVEYEMALRAGNLQKAERELQAAQRELEEFQKTDETFQPDFLSLKTEFETLNNEILELNNGPTMARLALMKKMEELRARVKTASSLDEAGQNLIEITNLSKESVAIDQKEKENAPLLAGKEARYAELEKIVSPTLARAEKKQRELSGKLTECKAARDKCASAVESFPTLRFYLSDQLPALREKATTDADGRFEMKLPRSGKFAVFAEASRKVAADTEKYAWFFWLPSAGDEAPLMLSNNNLIFSDYPGNVLPIKPKAIE